MWIFHTIAGTIVAQVVRGNNVEFEVRWPGVLQLLPETKDQSTFNLKARIEPIALIGETYTMQRAGIRGHLITKDAWVLELYKAYVQQHVDGKFAFNPLQRSDFTGIKSPDMSTAPTKDIATIHIVQRPDEPGKVDLKATPNQATTAPEDANGTEEGPVVS